MKSYLIVGTKLKDGRSITFDWHTNIFDLDRSARFLENQGYITKAWVCEKDRKQLW